MGSPTEVQSKVTTIEEMQSGGGKKNCWGRLPEIAADLRRAFLVGGDLPKAHLDGGQVCKVSGWRPLLDLGEGASVGVLLEENGQELSLTVFQDGVRRCSTTARKPETWAGEPHGVVDVCGCVRRV